MRADLTAIQVKSIVAMLADQLGDEPDDRLLLDSLEAETDLFEIASKLLGRVEDEEGAIKVLNEQMSDRKARADRAKRRMDGYRATIRALMETAKLDKLPLPEATVTLRKLEDKLVIQKHAVSDDYMKAGPKVPDVDKIEETFATAEELPNWLTRETDRRSLTIKRK